ncbi:hypothetical protein [Aureliella helgolandensis]|uniref:Uncharacterized protein n=1 Tax=Aureliella helgolandensis TaxID=2527968 RepID=A0A518GAD6_9BACT|nr:hypothetical protein [Aureliella helgolandensis]QDV25523.1 hypothetical protein Q31a_38490 [Aureliella helgolandensis]
MKEVLRQIEVLLQMPQTRYVQGGHRILKHAQENAMAQGKKKKHDQIIKRGSMNSYLMLAFVIVVLGFAMFGKITITGYFRG